MTRGEVVEANWPYSDLSGTKVRPAVVVQADFLNGLVDDTILVKVTGTRYGIPNTEVLLDPYVETGSGLSKLCYASCKDILTSLDSHKGVINLPKSNAARCRGRHLLDAVGAEGFVLAVGGVAGQEEALGEG